MAVVIRVVDHPKSEITVGRHTTWARRRTRSSPVSTTGWCGRRLYHQLAGRGTSRAPRTTQRVHTDPRAAPGATPGARTAAAAIGKFP